jgi:hypothetical protein
MNFGEAIQSLKNGSKVARSGWNGKGMYLYYVPANVYPAVTDVAVKNFGELVPYTAYVAIKTVAGNVSPWQPSNNDMLSEDWIIVP